MKFVLKKVLLFIILSIFILITLTGCDNTDNKYMLKEKVNKEMEYLDSELLSLLNKLNNISFSTYKIETEDITVDNADKNQESDSLGGNSSESSSNSEQSSNQTSSSVQGQSKGTSQSNKNTTITNLVSNGILANRNSEIDWQYLQQNIENLYSSWSTTILDLYNLGINNNDILNFSTTLDYTIISIKDENKIDSLNNLAKLYMYIPIYLYSFSDDEILKNVQQTKTNIITAYSLVEQNKWDEISDSLANAERYFMIIVNNTNVSKEKQILVNKTYTLLKELQNSISLKDKEVFYIKYKSLIEEIENI